MTRVPARRQACTKHDAQIRATQARAFLETAKLVMSERGKPEDVDFNHVAAGNAVLAAIAASDAICCRFLGERSRGQDHREAIVLLEQVRLGPGSPAEQARRAKQLATALATALDLKDDSHYGLLMIGAAELRRLVRAAEKLTEAAATMP